MLPISADIFPEPDGDTACGTCSADFLVQAFSADACRCDVTFNDDGNWTHLISTELFGRGEPFDHHVRRLQLPAPPKHNPLAAIGNACTGSATA